MSPPTAPDRDQNARLPADIISPGGWRYARVCVSSRAGEARLCTCGVLVTDEALRTWWRTFGQADANQRRRRRPRPGDTWQMDEVLLTSHGAQPDRWRAVEQAGPGLDILVQRRRRTQAAQHCVRQLLKA